MATDNQSDVSPHLKPIHRVAGKEMAQRMSDSVAENLGQRCIARPAGLGLKFGHFGGSHLQCAGWTALCWPAALTQVPAADASKNSQQQAFKCISKISQHETCVSRT